MYIRRYIFDKLKIHYVLRLIIPYRQASLLPLESLESIPIRYYLPKKFENIYAHLGEAFSRVLGVQILKNFQNTIPSFQPGTIKPHSSNRDSI